MIILVHEHPPTSWPDSERNGRRTSSPVKTFQFNSINKCIYTKKALSDHVFRSKWRTWLNSWRQRRWRTCSTKWSIPATSNASVSAQTLVQGLLTAFLAQNYKEGEMNKAESVCVDRCSLKYMEMDGKTSNLSHIIFIHFNFL